MIFFIFHSVTACVTFFEVIISGSAPIRNRTLNRIGPVLLRADESQPKCAKVYIFQILRKVNSMNVSGGLRFWAAPRLFNTVLLYN